MGRFDSIKDKAEQAKEKADEGVSGAKERAQEAKEKTDERVDDRVDTAKNRVDESRTTVFEKIEDTKTRVKKPLKEPEMRKEGTLTSEKHFFICSNCGDELGPITEKQYSKLIKPALKGSKAIIGVATGNPIMVVSGAAGAAKGASDAKKVDDGGLVKLPRKRIKELKQNREEGSQFLSQCNECIEWVCMDCWNADEGVCIDCA